MWDQYLNHVREIKKNKKKTREHEGDGNTNCGWCT